MVDLGTFQGKSETRLYLGVDFTAPCCWAEISDSGIEPLFGGLFSQKYCGFLNKCFGVEGCDNLNS